MKFVTFFNSLADYFAHAFVVENQIVVVIGVIFWIWAYNQPNIVL